MIKYRNFRKSSRLKILAGLESFALEVLLALIFLIISIHSFKTEMLIVAIPLALLSLGCSSAAIISLYFYIKLK